MVQEYLGRTKHQRVAMKALTTLSLFKDDNQAKYPSKQRTQDRNPSHDKN